MRTVCILFLLFLPLLPYAQELYPHNEPASNVPAKVLGFRLSNEWYDELGQLRSMQSYRLMWGFTPELMISQSLTFSNHHGEKLPEDFIASDGRIGLHTHGIQKGKDYPYQFENVSYVLKYRFLSLDNKNRHFRMAASLDAAFGSRAHDEAEPGFYGDNSGYGAGVVATYLNNKLAVSTSVGYIKPNKYSQKDLYEVNIHYGDAFTYNLSLGYLILPFKYKSYKQTNLNLYVEFMGKTYGKADVKVDGSSVILADVPGLEKGNYIELRPSLQLIIHSNTRLDFSIAKPLLEKSYVRFYPAYYVNLQHYFFF